MLQFHRDGRDLELSVGIMSKSDRSQFGHKGATNTSPFYGELKPDMLFEKRSEAKIFGWNVRLL